MHSSAILNYPGSLGLRVFAPLIGVRICFLAQEQSGTSEKCMAKDEGGNKE